MTSIQDAVVVGSGPNGLAAAITLARAGLAVRVIEGADTPGGGCRTAELTLPGFRHDICSAVHPLAAASPFFAELDLPSLGLTLRTPKIAFAQPLDGGRAAWLGGSADETAGGLGPDGRAYRGLLKPLVRQAPFILADVLTPLRSLPDHPVATARFALSGLPPASLLAKCFRTDEARALIAGAAAHAMLPLTAIGTGAYGLMFMIIGHAVGWPVAAGGSAKLVGALTAELGALGVEIETGRWVRSLSELPPARTVLFDLTPRQFAELAGTALSARQRRSLGRFRYGPGVCKVDWALSGPVPWQASVCRETCTLHVGGTFDEVARSEAEVSAGSHPERPFCIVVQPGVVDLTRAPAGRHTLWGYCHVPAGSSVDMSARIEAQIERFAPGFSDLIMARSVRTAADMERYNPNYVGGDINGGAATLRHTLVGPELRWNPYRTALPGVFLCSSSTPPGGGVHGMCGAGAARAALTYLAR